MQKILSALENGSYWLVPPHMENYSLLLELKMYGHERWTSGQMYQNLHSDVTSLEYIVSGDMVYTENEEDYLVSAGEMFILRRGCSHTFRTGPAGFGHKRFLLVSSVCIDAMLHAAGLSEPTVIHLENPVVMQSWFRRAGTLTRNQPIGFRDELSVLLYKIILESARSTSASYPASVCRVLTFMSEHYMEKLTLDDLTRISGQSQRHFFRLFKQATGEAPMQGLHSLRLKKACDMLCNTDLPISEIAKLVGHDDPLYFSAFFKKHLGQSPSKIRAQSRPKRSVRTDEPSG